MNAAADALAIANLKASYCRIADGAANADAQGLAAATRALCHLFAADPVGDYGYGPLAGADAIAGFVCGAIAGGSRWMIHMLHSPHIVVAGDAADGGWAVTVRGERLETGAASLVVGRYADRFVRTAQGWRIARIGFARLA